MPHACYECTRSQNNKKGMRTYSLYWLLTALTSCQAMSTSSSCTMKRILVTGGNKGIGKAIVSRLLTEWKDTHVVMGSRSVERGQQAIQDLIAEIPGDIKDRLELLELDTSSDESVKAAADKIANEPELYGIINNAGVMGRGGTMTMEDVINTNYFGPRRINDTFGKLLKSPGGRIVNIASASGPNFVEPMSAGDPLKEKLTKPWTITGGIAELDSIAQNMKGNSYGASKALVNAYTGLHAKADSNLIINSCSPGWIATDMTQGMGASNPPSKGAVVPCWLMMDEEVATQPTGRYYGSDCVRSPLHYYRGPGEDPYVNDEDLV